MDNRIAKALKASLSAYKENVQNEIEDVEAELIAVFESEESYMQKVELLDQFFDNHPVYDALREITFDLLLMNFFAADVSKLEEDYLESEEWEFIEEQTIDRGTELLNLLLYLRECLDEDLEPELDDFLKEFLLVDEDEFQDEYRIYEPLLANQILIESSFQEIYKVADKIEENQELVELFYPIMSFFMEKEPDKKQLEEYTHISNNRAFDTAIYALIIAYYQK
ncbi:hypothetical protein H8S90_25160 [Olivibacter sp. SDN3]|uniref:hypothetical protein n=1 Tax=Olivibacter sp. SDN3 TaxID=2764720 RepID=UPI001651997F|nr:hypothetical protein [Olivibacter sp. SDN3]QNL49935.1 hypothetical protein H8S90_25160 [Olivibacter sp. SDN3]